MNDESFHKFREIGSLLRILFPATVHNVIPASGKQNTGCQLDLNKDVPKVLRKVWERKIKVGVANMH